jgi:precorrin-6A synthase
MRRMLVIGVGAGDPEYVTVQAIKALNEVDVIFVVEKGSEKRDLVALRKEICARYIENRSYRFVEIRDPERDRAASSYRAGVEEWRRQRADLYEASILAELGQDECGAFLVWGDPAIYDSTLAVLDEVLARGALEFDVEVVPGISSVQALAAKHRISLNRIGEPIHLTTGRRLAGGVPEGVDDVVVLLDASCSFQEVEADVEIYWGAYVGTQDELLVSGRLTEVADEIVRLRSEARERKGWIMDTYLLRKPAP